MPLAFPNLDHRQFNFSITTASAASNSVNALTRLPGHYSNLASDPIPPLYDFTTERELVSEAKDTGGSSGSGSTRRASRSSVASAAAAQGAAQGDAQGAASSSSIASEEDRLNRELESARKSTADNSTGSGGGEAKETSKSDGAGGQTDVRRAMLQRMKSLTMANTDECESYLQKADYNLEEAVTEFYNHN
jgi:hypothetical protein